jgi:two-component system, NarL family, sensor histidine kinase DesK
MHMRFVATAEPSSGAPPDAQHRLARGWRFGPLLALVFLGYPLQTAFTLDPTPDRVFLTLGATALFAAAFIWLLWTRGPFRSGLIAPAEAMKRRAAVTCLAALVVALNVGLARGPEWLVLFFHVSAAAGLVLPRRDAYAAVALLAAIGALVGSRADLAFIALPTTAVGLWAIAFSGQVAAVAELRAAREELARRAVADERLRFARDLHDLLGHSLSLITLKNELAGKLLPGEPERAGREVKDAEEVARRALREVRAAVAGYRQPTLREELLGAREMLASAGVACRIENGAHQLPRPVDAVLAWTVREGVTNVIRHSRARHCTVRVTRSDRCVSAEVADDGRGAPKPNAAGAAHAAAAVSPDSPSESQTWPGRRSRQGPVTRAAFGCASAYRSRRISGDGARAARRGSGDGTRRTRRPTRS